MRERKVFEFFLLFFEKKNKQKNAKKEAKKILFIFIAPVKDGAN